MPVWGKAGYSPGYITCRIRTPADVETARARFGGGPTAGRSVEWGGTMKEGEIAGPYCGKESARLVEFRPTHGPGVTRPLMTFMCPAHYEAHKALAAAGEIVIVSDLPVDHPDAIYEAEHW